MYNKAIESDRAEKASHDKNQKVAARKRLDDIAAKLKLKRKSKEE